MTRSVQRRRIPIHLNVISVPLVCDAQCMTRWAYLLLQLRKLIFFLTAHGRSVREARGSIATATVFLGFRDNPDLEPTRP
jgi:hypothetical protein